MNNSKIDFSQRNTGIDLLRALTMFVMIFVNDFWKIHDVPAWLEHAKRGEDFLGLADTVFPIFLFVVGMSIPFAIERRYNKGMSGESTIGHILSRTLALLVMGAFITNSEARLSPDVSYSIGVYWILMVTAFILIWNQYPETKDLRRKRLFNILKIIGVIILVGLAVTYRDPKGGVFGARWGILGAIGWTYMLCAFIYMFTRDRLKYLVPIWIIFVIICILGSKMNESWGGTAILALPRPNFYNEMLSILHIGNGALPAFTMGGLILSLISTKYLQTSSKKKAVYIISAVAIFFLAGIISRQFWILSKLSATPTWIFIVTSIAIAVYALLSWLAEKGKANWLNIIKPAGTATLTCYLIPYVSYALADITGIVLPDWFTHGIMGIVNCLSFALVIIGVTWFLGRIHIKLKI
jgi:MFS family permease